MWVFSTKTTKKHSNGKNPAEMEVELARFKKRDHIIQLLARTGTAMMGLQPLRTQRAQTEQVMPSAKHRCQQARPTGQRGTANLFIQLSRN